MADPWKVLGVKPGSSDEEIKKAYHSLVKKYHPDRFQDAAAKELANEKLKEVNQAYDEISGGGGSSYSSPGGSGANYNTNYTSSGSQRFYQVRQDLQARRVDNAEQALDQMSDRNAEWHFLRGVCYSLRGWYAMAHENIAMAVNMEPNNVEFRNALNQLDNSSQGYQQFTGPFGQARQGGAGSSGCSMCDVCSCMLCTDCLCNSCGGC
jgi:molecular chaperone DnaJ